MRKSGVAKEPSFFTKLFAKQSRTEEEEERKRKEEEQARKEEERERKEEEERKRKEFLDVIEQERKYKLSLIQQILKAQPPFKYESEYFNIKKERSGNGRSFAMSIYTLDGTTYDTETSEVLQSVKAALDEKLDTLDVIQMRKLEKAITAQTSSSTPATATAPPPASSQPP